MDKLTFTLWTGSVNKAILVILNMISFSKWEEIKANSYISGDAVSGALILKPSFSRLQNSSSIWTPGYGDAPVGVQKEKVTWSYFFKQPPILQIVRDE